MRVLVCGSRTFEDRAQIWNVLDGTLLAHTLHCAVLGEDEEFVLIEGVCPTGADHVAGEWAETAVNGHPMIAWKGQVTHLPFPAQWRVNGKFVRAAGIIRNQRMLDEGKPDIVLAFVDKPLQESVGTYDMVKRARKANVPVYLIWRM